MIGWFLFGICLITGLYLIGSWFMTANPKNMAKTLRYVAAGLVGFVALVLMVSGRFGLGLALLPVVLMCLGRWRPRMFPGLSGMRAGFPGFGQAKASPGNVSEVETDYVEMTLEHDSGVMQGKVLKGKFAGKSFADMTDRQIIALWQECQTADPEAAQLVEAYLDRTQGPDWRGGTEGGQSGGGSAGTTDDMTPAEAYEVLGLRAGADAQEIREAYRKMMQKYHPDSGGSTDMAAKINQAKDILLGT